MVTEKDPLLPRQNGTRQQGSPSKSLFAGAALAVVVLVMGGAAYYHQRTSLSNIPYLYDGGPTDNRCMVYTFYDDIGFDNAEVQAEIEVWAESYRESGWTPAVLTSKHAKQHPSYNDFVAKWQTFPTTNPQAYELACFVRWLAVASVGGGWMADSDTINVNLPPPPNCNSLPRDGALTLHQRAVPALVSGTAEAFATFASNAANVDMNEYKQWSANNNGGEVKVMSDMNLAFFFKDKGMVSTTEIFRYNPKDVADVTMPPCTPEGVAMSPLLFHISHDTLEGAAQYAGQPRQECMAYWFGTLKTASKQCTPVQYDESTYYSTFFPEPPTLGHAEKRAQLRKDLELLEQHQKLCGGGRC